MPTGYCTVDDVRRVLQDTVAEFDSGATGNNQNQVVVDAIQSQTEWLEKTAKRHWYVSTAPSEDTHELIPTTPKTRDDEHDLPRSGGLVHGASEDRRHRFRMNSDALLESGPRHDRRRRHDHRPKREIRLAFGDLHDETVPAYTRITLDRRDVEAVNELHVVNANGGFDDWTQEKTGGVGTTHRGGDYWLRVNNGGVSELYLNVHSMDDDLASLSNAVYVDIDYGHEGLPRTVRRAIAMRSAAQLLAADDEASLGIPENANLQSIESKVSALERQADDLLEVYL